MLNRIVLAGRLTREPEMSYTASGIAVAKFTLAVDRIGKNKETGEKETDFINIVAWRKQAEIVGEYFCKGLLVSAEGRLQIRNFVNRDGNRQWVTEVVADGVGFLESKANRERLASGASEQQEARSESESDPMDNPKFDAPADRPSPVAPGRSQFAAPAASTTSSRNGSQTGTAVLERPVPVPVYDEDTDPFADE